MLSEKYLKQEAFAFFTNLANRKYLPSQLCIVFFRSPEVYRQKFKKEGSNFSKISIRYL